MTRSEGTLYLKLANGERISFHEFFCRYYPKVKNFICAIVKSESAAEDIAQDVFVKLWSKGSSRLGIFNSIKSADLYLFKACKNESLNYLKSNAKRQSSSLESILIDDKLSRPDNMYQISEQELLIQLLVENMPERRRDVYKLSREENMSNEKIADKLHISKKTVENHLNLALRDIRALLSI